MDRFPPHLQYPARDLPELRPDNLRVFVQRLAINLTDPRTLTMRGLANYLIQIERAMWINDQQMQAEPGPDDMGSLHCMQVMARLLAEHKILLQAEKIARDRLADYALDQYITGEPQETPPFSPSDDSCHQSASFTPSSPDAMTDPVSSHSRSDGSSGYQWEDPADANTQASDSDGSMQSFSSTQLSEMSHRSTVDDM